MKRSELECALGNHENCKKVYHFVHLSDKRIKCVAQSSSSRTIYGVVERYAIIERCAHSNMQTGLNRVWDDLKYCSPFMDAKATFEDVKRGWPHINFILHKGYPSKHMTFPEGEILKILDRVEF